MRMILIIISILLSFRGPAYAQNVTLEPLNAQSVTGIEVLVADSSDNALESRFGHGLVRLVLDSSDPFNDIVISFEANLPSSIGTRDLVIGGLFGKFQTVVKQIRLIDVLAMYSQQMNRGFNRIPLRLTRAQINSFVSTLKKLMARQIEMPVYTFTNFNCARAVTWTFEHAGIRLLADTPVPTQLPYQFSMSLVAPWGTFLMPSGAKSMGKIRFRKLKNEEIDFSQKNLSALSDEEVFVLSMGNYKFSAAAKTAMSDRLKNFDMAVESVYNVVHLLPFQYISDTQSKSELAHKINALDKHSLQNLEKHFLVPHMQLEQQIRLMGKRAPENRLRVYEDCRNCDLLEILSNQ